MKPSPSLHRSTKLQEMLAALALAASPCALHAEVVIINGADGAQGVTYVDQYGQLIPGRTGGYGADGQDVLAVADRPGEALNQAVATGGTGGGGGSSGGPGEPNIPPAFGPHGGNGGAATATAKADRTTTGGGNVEARADAGSGVGGAGGAGGSRPHMDGPGAWGGKPTATATAKTTNGSVISYANATSRYGSGNLATASASGSNSSADPVNVVATANGGNGPIKNGDRNGPTPDEAPHGLPGVLGVVEGISTGGGNVRVEGSAYGGDGGVGVGSGIDGADVAVTNAVTGSTTGTLTLYQRANGGSGGQGLDQDAGWGGYFPVLMGQGGRGGDATSIMDLSGSPASSLAIQVYATGGSGGIGNNGGPGQAGTATAGGNVSGMGDLSAYYSASGGGGGRSNAGFAPGAAAIVTPSSAVSTGTGKTVSVTANQRGGDGSGTGYYTPRDAGDGAPSSLTNIVSGAAPGGNLTLNQTAVGGTGGSVAQLGNYSGVLPGGGGDALSTLDFTHNGEANLTANVEAYGGQTGLGWGNRLNKAGGDATAGGHLQDSGEVTLIVKAFGGHGGDAGNASAVGSAISTGSGTAALWVESKGGKTNVNDTAPGAASVTAYGQSVSGLVSVFGIAEAGSGFAANGTFYSGRVDGRSLTLANAVSGRTQGKLILSQTATGGAGTGDQFGGGGSAGDGGNATSSLIMPAGNPDGGPMEAEVYAYGGDSTAYNSQTIGAPGNAVAVCDIQNAGNVRAEARANGGVATQNALTRMGVVQATANAVCTQPYGSTMAIANLARCDPSTAGPAAATAETLGGIASRLRASSSIPALWGATYTSVGCAVGANIYNPGVSVVGLPTNPLNISGAPSTSAAFLGATRLADMSFTGNFGTTTTTLAFNTANYLGRARLSLLSGALSDPGGTVTGVRFTVTKAAITIVDVTFNSAAALQSYFTDHVIDLGRANALGELVCTFTLTGGDRNTYIDAKVLLAASPLPAPVNYQPNASTGGGAFIDISSTGTQVIGSGADDEVSNLIPIGFTCPFFGTNYTDLYANSNGLVTFGGANSAYDNIDFAAQTMSPNLDAIAVLWDDWLTTGGVFAQTIGAPGQRTFIVQWNVRAFSGTSADPAVFQMQIFENTGDVLIVCPDTVTDGGNSNGSSATLGLRKAGAPGNGFVTMHSFNTPNVPSGTQVRFSLPRPVVGGLVATNVTANTATLGGVINPNGNSTTGSFQYGLTTSYGGTASVVLTPDDGVAGQNVSAALTGLAAGTTYYYQLTATNDAGTSILSGSFTTLSQQQGWRQQYFGTSSNSGDAADNADPDGDGLMNLLEWACGLNPTSGSQLNTTASSTGGGAPLEFIYPRAAAALNAGLVFRVEWSDTMAPNSWSTAGVTEQVLSDNGITQQMRATLPTASGVQRFVRLRVTAPP